MDEACLLAGVADDQRCSIIAVFVERKHIKLPFEMLAQIGRVRQKLLKARCVILVLDFLRAVSRVKVVLKFAAVIDLVKGILGFRVKVIIRCGIQIYRLVTIERRRVGHIRFGVGVIHKGVLDRVRARIVTGLKLSVVTVRILIKNAV